MTAENEKTESYCGYVGLLGAPNAGKSTLLNELTGGKIAIVTPKPQTTRRQIRGILTEGAHQFIFVDTPGIFDASAAYERAMVEHAWSGAKDADALLFLLDAQKGVTEADRRILQKLAQQYAGKPLALVLNKVDRIPEKARLLELVRQLQEIHRFDEVFYISALKGEGVEALRAWLAARMPAGPWLYPEDQMSDLPLRFLAAEVTREKLFLRLRQELPYGLMVETEEWKNQKDGSTRVSQVIIVEREAHKAIVVGAKGQQLKQVGQAARRDLEKMVEGRVHLFLFVKVVPGWKEKREYAP